MTTMTLVLILSTYSIMLITVFIWIDALFR